MTERWRNLARPIAGDLERRDSDHFRWRNFENHEEQLGALVPRHKIGARLGPLLVARPYRSYAPKRYE